MLVKLTSKNQITLPKSAVMAFAGTAYYAVEIRPEGLLLRPAKIHVASKGLEDARERFKEKGLNETTIAQAVRWARM